MDAHARSALDAILRRWGTKYREPVREDLTPGATLLMLDLRFPVDLSTDPRWSARGTVIRLDDEQPDPDNTVYYHCTNPAWEGQCFVSVKDFLGQGEPSHTPCDLFVYVIEIKQDA